jgi:hypothetical protein
VVEYLLPVGAEDHAFLVPQVARRSSSAPRAYPETTKAPTIFGDRLPLTAAASGRGSGVLLP